MVAAATISDNVSGNIKKEPSLEGVRKVEKGDCEA
jgi:hypothetical protein